MPAKNQPKSARPGFSIIELLTVIFVIALILTLVIPSLSRVRSSARRSETSALMATLDRSIGSFVLDQGRAPGYFSQVDMNNSQNETRGFTQMQNILLDLVGGVAVQPNGTPETDSNPVGPKNNATVAFLRYKLGTGGVGNKQYFNPGKSLPSEDEQLSDNLGVRSTTVDAHRGWDLFDPTGAPILAWVKDSTYTGQITGVNDVIRENSDNTAQRAQFYYTANAAMLSQQQSGRKRVNQEARSFIGTGTNWNARSISMVGLLGNPGSPGNINAPATQPGLESIYPTSPRGSVVLQAAGEDGVFLSKEDRQGVAKIGVIGGNTAIGYGYNFRSQGGTPLVNTTGQPQVTDVVGGFDDIIVGSGG